MTLAFFQRTPTIAAPVPAADAGRERRLRALFEAHWEFVARLLRHLGVPEADLDDGLQQVFLVAADKLADIRPGAERAFAAQTAVHMAARVRRALGRSREVAGGDDDSRPDGGVGPDEALDRARALRRLDDVLGAMEFDLRTVFVMYEVEELTMAEIARALDIPPGTVASRLRRARDDFHARAALLRRPQVVPGGTP